MPKFRYLTDEELTHLEEELKQFLIVNEVYHEEWVKINQEKQGKALELVALFSDQVLQRVYEKMAFLEKRTKDACFVFHFESDKIHLKVIQSERNENLDLSTPESIHEAMTKNFSDLSFFKSTKNMTGNREQEIHRLIEQGAVPSNKEFWEQLEKIIA